ncbi:hypothetical protein U1Q18_001978 [Sarracenia purpurea var. burkii]
MEKGSGCRGRQHGWFWQRGRNIGRTIEGRDVGARNRLGHRHGGKEVFIGILGSAEKLTDEMYKWSDEKLAEEMRLHLQTKSYLIVMDDMWIRGPWDDLKMAFPKNNNRSRILLTSRNKEVAVHANPYNLPHFLRFLNNVGSWEPLERVFRKESCPPELEVHGKQFTKECCGLPLAIVLIVGLLVKKRENVRMVGESG